MSRLAERIERLARNNDGLVFLTQSTFDAWADRRSRWSMRVSAIAFALLLASIAFAVAVISPRFFREGHLLWRGTGTEAKVLEASLAKQSVTKGGTQLYRLEVTYEFIAADQRLYRGAAARGDLSTPVTLSPGEAIRIVYEPGDPAVSTIEHNLRIDVYALALFLPFLLLVPGSMGTLYLVRYARWRPVRH